MPKQWPCRKIRLWIRFAASLSRTTRAGHESCGVNAIAPMATKESSWLDKVIRPAQKSQYLILFRSDNTFIASGSADIRDPRGKLATKCCSAPTNPIAVHRRSKSSRFPQGQAPILEAESHRDRVEITSGLSDPTLCTAKWSPTELQTNCL
ncbi:hypothetical protein B0H19DRAFT_1149938 [Mycena capillaripes]|nr:hypothetical protein B0H19DRAFT_1149938 [Mycena capillaripes]